MLRAHHRPTVSKQQIIVLENCRFMECLLTTVKHKWISQIREHITTPLMTRDVESCHPFQSFIKMLACNGGLMPTKPGFYPALLPHNIRHYVLHLGRLDLKVMTPDGLIRLRWRTSHVSFVFLLVIIFVVVVFDGTAHVAGDNDTHQL